MTPTDLPHGFVASRYWAWQSGMTARLPSGATFTYVDGMPTGGLVPVTTPPTLGCILARIRGLRDDLTICPIFDPLNGWALKSYRDTERLTAWHEAEEEAYLDGLEGCP